MTDATRMFAIYDEVAPIVDAMGAMLSIALPVEDWDGAFYIHVDRSCGMTRWSCVPDAPALIEWARGLVAKVRA